MSYATLRAVCGHIRADMSCDPGLLDSRASNAQRRRQIVCNHAVQLALLLHPVTLVWFATDAIIDFLHTVNIIA